MKILVVGAGLSGSVIARELAEHGHQIDVIESRYHIGGNCYDYYNEHNIRVHKYGPHLFHTSNMKVVEWLSQFTEWIKYKHKVRAMLDDGRMVVLPVNKETKEIVGEENVLDIFFRPYTYKMWNKTLDELDPSIINRVPIRDDDNEFYFPKDTFQAMPKDGYTAMFRKILKHRNITVHLNTKFNKDYEDQYDYVFNCMPIDVYFDKIYGELPYRSIKFHHVHMPCPKLLPVACVNFTHNGPYTRMTEWKNIPNHGENSNFTTITYEEPCDYVYNNFERYYPVKDVDGKNRATYKKYEALVDSSKMQFVGRTGMYCYFDMHQAIAAALNSVSKFLQR